MRWSNWSGRADMSANRSGRIGGLGLRVLGVLALLVWPPLVWLSIHHAGYRWLVPALALLLLLRLLVLRGQRGALALAGWWLTLCALALCAGSMLLRDSHLLLWYPVLVNAVMLMLFAGSLWSPMPLVERLARLTDPQLPARAIRYTRQVTRVWCLFFVLNGSVALTTCLMADMRWWTLWNGMISYLLMATLMGGEWLVRQRVKARP